MILAEKALIWSQRSPLFASPNTGYCSQLPHVSTFYRPKRMDIQKKSYLCTRKQEKNIIIMATIVLQVPDESLVSKVKQACKMLMGVASVKVQKPTTAKPKTRIYDPETGCYLNERTVKAIEEAHEDMKHGRLKSYDSVDAMFQDLGINV
jgi:hypothetical protein